MAHAAKINFSKKNALGRRSALGVRLAWAGGLLAVGLAMAVTGAQIGVVHVNAGEMKIVMGRSESGFIMDIAGRNCPPNCGFDVHWLPLAALAAGAGG